MECHAAKMPTLNKGQSANEAVLLISFLTLVMILTIGFVSDDIIRASHNNYRKVLSDLAYVIEKEASIAFGSENGYMHSFRLPPTLNGQPYKLSITSSVDLGIGVNTTVLAVASSRAEVNLTRYLPRNVTGGLVRGWNSVRKENGGIIFTPLPLTPEEEMLCNTCEMPELCCDHDYPACCT